MKQKKTERKTKAKGGVMQDRGRRRRRGERRKGEKEEEERSGERKVERKGGVSQCSTFSIKQNVFLINIALIKVCIKIK